MRFVTVPPPHQRRELDPGQIAMALIFADIAPPDFTAPFCYVELKSGDERLSTDAMRYPQGRFIAADVAQPRALEALPDTIDVIVVNNVWSRTDTATRAALTQVVAEKLSARGVVVIDYATAPGAIMPAALHRMGLDLAEKAQGARSSFFTANPRASKLLDSMRGRPLTAALDIFTFKDLSQKLAALGLDFAGAARMADAIPKLNFSAAAMKMLQDETDPVFREMEKDLLLNRGHRCDIFVNNPQRNDSTASAGRLAQIKFMPTITLAAADKLVLQTAYAEIKLNDNARRVFTALTKEPGSAIDVAQRGVEGCANVWANVDAMLALTAMDAIAPTAQTT